MRVQVQLHMYTHVSFGARPAGAGRFGSVPPWVLRAMQKAAAGGEDHPDERETKRPKWSREQHLTDLGSAISWAMMDLQRYRDMIAKCKEAQSGEEFERLFNAIRDDEKLRKTGHSPPTVKSTQARSQKAKNSSCRVSQSEKNDEAMECASTLVTSMRWVWAESNMV